MTEKKSLSEGDKYLSISIKASEALSLALKAVFSGVDKIYLPAFKQEPGDNKPLYASQFVAVWLKTKKSDVKEDKVEL